MSSEIDEKLIELVRKCEDLYDMSNKKYSNSVWKERIWGQIGEELKKSGKFEWFFIAHSEVTIILQGGSNMTGTDLCVNKPHCAAAVRP